MKCLKDENEIMFFIEIEMEENKRDTSLNLKEFDLKKIALQLCKYPIQGILFKENLFTFTLVIKINNLKSQ